MTESERVRKLEAILIMYVKLFGFIDESRDYYLRLLALEGQPSDEGA
ncbi:hypothetical protein [Sulfitobacter sp. 1A12157]